MTDWLVNVADPDDEEENMGEKRMYVDPDWMKPKDENKEEVDPKQFKKEQGEFLDKIAEEYKLGDDDKKNDDDYKPFVSKIPKRFLDTCPGYLLNENGEVDRPRVNIKHDEWIKTVQERLFKSRQHYYHNIARLNNYAINNGGVTNSQMFENDEFTVNNKVISQLNENLRSLFQTVFTSFEMIFDTLENFYVEYKGNQQFGIAVSKFMDDLNNNILETICEDQLNVFDKDLFRIYSAYDNKTQENIAELRNKVEHFNQVNFYRFDNNECLIDFYKYSFDTYEKGDREPLEDGEKYMLRIYIHREMALINKEFYKFSCFLADTIKNPNLRYNTVMCLAAAAEQVSYKYFDFLLHGIELMIEESVKGYDFLTHLYVTRHEKSLMKIN